MQSTTAAVLLPCLSASHGTTLQAQSWQMRVEVSLSGLTLRIGPPQAGLLLRDLVSFTMIRKPCIPIMVTYIKSFNKNPES